MEEARQHPAVITLGFDPGGIGNFGCACIDCATGNAHTKTVDSVDAAIEYVLGIKAKEKVVSAGIDTLLHWQSTPSGWRGADEFLREKYQKTYKSVMCANELRGAMTIQGAVLAGRLREVWPKLFLTETHPKVLWHCLQKGVEYPRQEAWKANASATVKGWLSNKGYTGEIRNEHEFDAVFSGWAALQAYSANWKRDLFMIKAINQKSGNISVVPDLHYFWPE